MTERSMHRLVEVDEHRRKEAARAMALAFMEYPTLRYFFDPPPEDLSERIEDIFGLSMRSRLAAGVAIPGVETDGHLAGAALIEPPGGLADDPSMEAAWDDFAAAAGPGALGRFAEYNRLKSENTHPQPHWYLTAVGIEPACQGRGLGNALLGRVHEIAAADGRCRGVALDTQSADNVAYYRRRGYAVYAEHRLGEVPLWFMYRANG